MSDDQRNLSALTFSNGLPEIVARIEWPPTTWREAVSRSEQPDESRVNTNRGGTAPTARPTAQEEQAPMLDTDYAAQGDLAIREGRGTWRTPRFAWVRTYNYPPTRLDRLFVDPLKSVCGFLIRRLFNA